MTSYNVSKTPKDVCEQLAKKIKAIRKQKSWSQKELAERSGVAYASVRKFENTGLVSLISLLKIVDVVGRLEEFEKVLQPDDTDRLNKLFDI